MLALPAAAPALILFILFLFFIVAKGHPGEVIRAEGNMALPCPFGVKHSAETSPSP